ncbi:hypothetical protein [Bordetella sp. BOR01]|uniref:hypothetical protein n=1 Tax=Bordetella sp. BOR01 TaxID=2854779 RepID=UPI001C460C42|nr:hypothetical protein [Bordetella sp. BOR01]MBV7481964.1 hypothetical protein [Bordetella sp. BOR01]
MDDRRDLGCRALCVPVRRPSHLTLLGRTVVAGAAACAATAAWWQAGLPGLAALAGATGAGAAVRCIPPYRPRPAAGRIRAIRAVAGSRRWQVRLGRHWHGAVLGDTRHGACWLDLRLQIDSAAGLAVTNHRVAIWRSSVSLARWRRLCLLAGAAQRLDAPVPGAA